MTPNEYQYLCQRTVMSAEQQNKNILKAIDRAPALGHILVGGMKLSSEAGELQDALAKHIVYSQPLDYDNIEEECGDILWYVALVLEYCGTCMETVMKSNIDKLRIRYPEKFTEQDALERKDKVECPYCGGNHQLGACSGTRTHE